MASAAPGTSRPPATGLRLQLSQGGVADHSALRRRDDGRVYRGSGLTGYSPGEKSPFREHNGRWPFHVDPNDVRFVYFFDRKSTRQWHPLTWDHAALCIGPMNEDGLIFARGWQKQIPFIRQQAGVVRILRTPQPQSRTHYGRAASNLRLSRRQSVWPWTSSKRLVLPNCPPHNGSSAQQTRGRARPTRQGSSTNSTMIRASTTVTSTKTYWRTYEHSR